MRAKIIVFLAAVLVLNPVIAVASEIEVPEPGKILQATDLNYPGSIVIAKSCVRWEQTCRPNVFFPEQTDCETECAEWSYGSDASSSSSGSSYSSGSYASSGDPFLDLMLYGLLALVVVGGMFYLLGMM